MIDFGFYNMDCMKGMKEFPDKYFDLARERIAKEGNQITLWNN